jgi:methyl-accepting chemotaxis protein
MDVWRIRFAAAFGLLIQDWTLPLYENRTQTDAAGRRCSRPMGPGISRMNGLKVRNLPIQRKLTWIIMAASTVALLLVSVGFVVYELVTFEKSTKQDLSTLADILASQSRMVLAYGDERDGKELLDALSAKQHITAACLYKTNVIFAAYYARREHAAQPVPTHPEPDIYRYEKNQVVLFRHVQFKGRLIGTVYLRSDLLEKRARLEFCAGMAATLVFISSAVTFFLSFWLQRIVSRPISHLAQIARTVSEQKNYSLRAEKRSNDELGQLIDVFNGMLGQIQERDAALQHSNDRLEQHVRERTQDLEQQIAERKRAEGALQEQFTRTQLLNQIAQVISERQDLESILYVVLRQLEDYFAVDLGMVGLLDPAADTLNLTALRLKNPLLAAKLGLREGAVLPLEQAALERCRQGEMVNMPDTFKIHGQLAEQLASRWAS